MTNREEGYLYLPLADARKVIHVRANLFVAVVEIGAASRSKGTDYFLKLRIADPSYIAPGMSVNFFSGDTERLPRVKSSRDIICLRRVMMKIYNEEVYCAFHKKFSSFALFEGKSGSSFSPYQSSQNFHCVEHDVDCIKQLRTWLLDHQYAAGEELKEKFTLVLWPVEERGGSDPQSHALEANPFLIDSAQ